MTALDVSVGERESTQHFVSVWLAPALVVASLTELMVLRIGTRTAVHLPDLDRVQGPYQTVAALGRIAFFTATVLLVALLVRLAFDLRAGHRSALGVSVLAYVITAALAAAQYLSEANMGWMTIGVVAVLFFNVVRDFGPAGGVWLGSVGLAYLVAGSVTTLQVSGVGPSADSLHSWTVVAEYVAVLGAIGIGPGVRRHLGMTERPSRQLVLVSALVGLIVLVSVLANPWTAHILMLWNFGLAGAVPTIGYAIAAASLTLAIGTAWRSGEVQLASAIALIWLGGLGLISTYQSGLTVAGWALLGSSWTTNRHIAGVGAPLDVLPLSSDSASS